MNKRERRYRKRPGTGTGDRYLLAGAAILLGLSLTACGGGNKSDQAGEPAAAETVNTSEAEHASTEESSTEAERKAEETGGMPEQEDTQAQDSLPGGGAALPNPIQEVHSPADFEAIGLRLELPANETWYSAPVCSIIGGTIAQIHFFDEITESDAIVRAAKSVEGDISGVYYVFDDSKKQSWITKTEDGTRVDITVQVTTENSDVHGVLATWFYKDTSYSLWENDARELPDAVAKMAIEVMRMSDPENDEE